MTETIRATKGRGHFSGNRGMAPVANMAPPADDARPDAGTGRLRDR